MSLTSDPTGLQQASPIGCRIEARPHGDADRRCDAERRALPRRTRADPPTRLRGLVRCTAQPFRTGRSERADLRVTDATAASSLRRSGSGRTTGAQVRMDGTSAVVSKPAWADARKTGRQPPISRLSRASSSSASRMSWRGSEPLYQDSRTSLSGPFLETWLR